MCRLQETHGMTCRDGHDGIEYELRTVHGSERELFTSLSSAPNTRLPSTEENGYTHYQSETITDPMSKTAAVSATSLTTQHNYPPKTYSSGEMKPVVRLTMMPWLPELIAVVVSVGSLLAIVAVLSTRRWEASVRIVTSCVSQHSYGHFWARSQRLP